LDTINVSTREEINVNPLPGHLEQHKILENFTQININEPFVVPCLIKEISTRTKFERIMGCPNFLVPGYCCANMTRRLKDIEDETGSESTYLSNKKNKISDFHIEIYSFF